MDAYTVIIIVTLIAFLALAAALLVPVYRFLQREEEVSRQWTREALRRRDRDAPPPRNGAPQDAEETPPRDR